MVRTSVALTRSPASGLRLPACVCVCVAALMYFPGPTAKNTSTQLLTGRRTRSDVRGSQRNLQIQSARDVESAFHVV